MAVVITTPPLAEPVTLAEAKLHLRVDHSHEDAMILTLISAARVNVEQVTGMALMQQGQAYLCDNWPASGIVELPISPLQAVEEIRVHGNDGGFSVIDPAHYVVDSESSKPRVFLRGSRQWFSPARVVNGIEIRTVCGFGPLPEDVPAGLRQSMLLLIAHWYEHREAVTDNAASHALPISVMALLQPWKQVRL